MSITIQPQDYYCDIYQTKCIKASEHDFKKHHIITKKFCKKVCTMDLQPNSLRLYEHSKTCAQQILQTLNAAENVNPKVTVEYFFTNKMNNCKPIIWNVFCEKSNKNDKFTLFFSHYGMNFHLKNNTKKNELHMEISDFYYGECYDASKEQWSAEEIFFMAEVITIGFASLNVTKLTFELLDSHYKILRKNIGLEIIKIKVPSFIVNFFQTGTRYYENKGYQYYCDKNQYSRERFLEDAEKIKRINYVDFISETYETKEYFFQDIEIIRDIMLGDVLQYLFVADIEKMYMLMKRTFRGVTAKNISNIVDTLIKKIVGNASDDCQNAIKFNCILSPEILYQINHFLDISINISDYVLKIRKKRKNKWIKTRDLSAVELYNKNGDEFNSKEKSENIFTANDLQYSFSNIADCDFFLVVLSHVHFNPLTDVRDVQSMFQKIIESYDTIPSIRIEKVMAELLLKNVTPFFSNKTTATQSVFMKFLINAETREETIEMLLRFLPEDVRLSAFFQREIQEAIHNKNIIISRQKILYSLLTLK